MKMPILLLGANLLFSALLGTGNKIDAKELQSQLRRSYWYIGGISVCGSLVGSALSCAAAMYIMNRNT